MLSRDALSPRSVSLTNSDSSASSDGGFYPSEVTESNT